MFCNLALHIRMDFSLSLQHQGNLYEIKYEENNSISRQDAMIIPNLSNWLSIVTFV